MMSDRRCISNTFDTSANDTDAKIIASKLYTPRGGTKGRVAGREWGDTELIQKHTAHSDTMLLRKRKRGRAGGTAG